MITVTQIELFNIFASILSVCLAILAIWLSLTFFIKSKDSEKKVEVSLNKIEDSSNTLQSISMKLINRLTSALTTAKPYEEKLSEIIKSLTSSGGINNSDESSDSSTSRKELEQMRVDNLFSTLYYCAVSNLATSSALSASRDVDSQTIKELGTMLDQTKQDYELILKWINSTPKINEKIESSTNKHLYVSALSWQSKLVDLNSFVESLSTVKQ